MNDLILIVMVSGNTLLTWMVYLRVSGPISRRES